MNEQSLPSTAPVSLAAAKTALVFNCATPLGEAVAHEFLSKGFKVIACTDFAEGTAAEALSARGAQIETIALDERTATGERRIGELAKNIGAVVFTDITNANLKLLANLERAAPLRCVFVSANDVGISRDETRFSGFASAEARVSGSILSWTIVRPTMTYGHAEDGNLSVLAQRLKTGRRTIVPELEDLSHQPIHYQDVARAAVALTAWADGVGRVVPIGGPDKISLTALFDAVADAVEARKRPRHVPVGRLRFTTKAARMLRLHVPGGLSRSGRIERPRSVVTPPDMPAEARPQINLKTGLELLAKDLSRLDGTAEGAQLAHRTAPELPL
jgi:nucleoside-diphosphate-sugar epimerase